MKTKRIESRRPEVGGPSGRRISFPDYLRRQIERLTESGRLGTARNYLRTWNSLNAFLAGKPFPMHRFDSRFVEEYGEWLRRRGVVRNTVSFYMRVLRSVYNRAVGERLVAQTHPFGNVYTGIDRTRKRAVDERIIGRLSRLDLRGSAPLALARDLFVFSYCARGMAFVDMAFLQRQDIRDGVVHYVRHKTGQPLSVRLEPCMQAIVARYAGRAPGSPYVFPVLKSGEFGSAYRQYQVALNYYNRQLKRLAALVELETGLSSYTSRHSWATAARNHEVPLPVISAGLGHTSEHTTRIYLDCLESSVIDRANRAIVACLAGGE